jgi:hypothetical protein
MKKKILLGSGVSAGLATVTAVSTVLICHSENAIWKGNAVAGYLGLLSIALFFVGLAFPKDS